MSEKRGAPINRERTVGQTSGVRRMTKKVNGRAVIDRNVEGEEIDKRSFIWWRDVAKDGLDGRSEL